MSGMYVPDAFRQDDPRALFEHMSAYPFATLITSAAPSPSPCPSPSPASASRSVSAAASAAELSVSHVPLLLDLDAATATGRPVLRGHLARENPQVGDLANGTEALAIFHGPHGYVSPSAYVDPRPSVPTWNYAVVHVRGRARLVGGPELRAILEGTVARFDTSSWRLDESPEFLDRMLGAIVGFEIAIEAVQGKWKLSQNRSPEDRRAVAAWLEGGDPSSQTLARTMRASF